MNKRKIIGIAVMACIIAGMAALVAFVIPASSSMKDASGTYAVSAEYAGAEITDDTLLLYVTFDTNVDFFEIVRDITVASDETFANPFTLLSCIPDNGRYIYEFSVPDRQTLEKIYIEPPVLVVPTEIDTVTFSPQQCLEDQSMVYIQDEPWFTVSDISVSELDSTMYRVVVRILLESVNIPRFALMDINGLTIEALSSMNFDIDGIFDFGEFYFDIPASGEEEVEEVLANAEISISDALIRVDSGEIAYASNITGLTLSAVQ